MYNDSSTHFGQCHLPISNQKRFFRYIVAHFTVYENVRLHKFEFSSQYNNVIYLKSLHAIVLQQFASFAGLFWLKHKNKHEQVNKNHG